MHVDSTFISHLHSHIRDWKGGDTDLKGAATLHGKAPTGLHKEYPRMARIMLPAPEELIFPLDKALRERSSYFKCTSNRSLSESELGTLLGNAVGTRGQINRNYPSGGALFPIETYLVGDVLEGQPSGVFHYHPRVHALEFLWKTPDSFSMTDIVRAKNVPLGPMLMVFTSMWGRSAIKYGKLAYSNSLIEVGHMGQNILLTATALSIGGRPMNAVMEPAIVELLDLDERVEQFVYSILLCPSLNRAADK